jgi:Cu(I)/Ag(I) efflux system membrane fusion protein
MYNMSRMTITRVRTGTLLMALGLMFSCNMQQQEMTTDADPAGNYIRLSDAQIQLANINIAEVREGSIGRELSLTSVLKVNEQSVVTISSRIPGRIEKLYFRNTGEKVNKGDKLYEYYSDDLVDAQKQYFTLQSNNWNFTGKYEPSLALENTLLIMGMIPSQIEQLGKDGKILFRVTIYSPEEGKIRSINISEGQYVEAGETLFELAGDNNLWIEAQAYPSEIQYLKPGMSATALVPNAGETPVKCDINFISPAFESGKNVAIVRAVIENPGNRLHPGMFAILTVKTQIKYGMVIPSSAVISGIDGDVVWVREEGGEFSSRKVITNLQSGDSVLIMSGLDITDKIVTTGAYLLNSEMILQQGITSSPGTDSLNTTTGSLN